MMNTTILQQIASAMNEHDLLTHQNMPNLLVVSIHLRYNSQIDVKLDHFPSRG